MECSRIPEVSYTYFSNGISNKVLTERIPYNGTLELTFRCNLRCAHCYISGANKPNELTYVEILEILDVVSAEGCLWLLITGGEPLIRKDFLDIYMYAKKKGFLITLFTNGTLITDEIADCLKEWPPHKLEITLYGMTEATYEKVTQIKGSFNRCMKGIHKLIEKKILFSLKTVAMTLNVHEICQMKNYAKELGVDYRFDTLVHAGLEGNKNPIKVRLSPEEVLRLDMEDEERANAWTEFCDRFWGPVKSKKLYHCGAGKCSFVIDPYGRMCVCEVARVPSYDLRQGSFQDGFYTFFPKVLSQKIKDVNNICYKCEMLPLCNQCPGLAQLESGDQEKPVEYYCRITHMRAEAFKRR